MADVGDKVSVAAKAGPRMGVVTATTGTMLRVRWESGEESSIVPGPGTLRVLRKGRKPAPAAASAPARSSSAKAPSPKKAAKKAAATKAPAKKGPAKTSAAKKSPAKKSAAKKGAAKKSAAKKKGR